MTFKAYQCHKQVHARPMSRGDYNVFRGWTIPSNEEPDDAGYLVIYSKDSPDEHISWSPKQVFDAGYTEIED